MQWSKYQQAIFDDITNRAGSLNVNAVAGSGKTTTLAECARRHPLGTGKVLAFNKIISQELGRRLPDAFDAQTFNACGFREIRTRQRGVKVDGRKLFFIMKDDDSLAGPTQGDDKYELRQALRNTVDLMKANAFGIDGDYDEGDIATLVDNKEIDHDPLPLDQFIELAIRLFDLSLEGSQMIDFSDQLFLPVYRGWRFDQWPVVFADEAQDLSPIQHLMLLRMSDNIVAFGDPHQAIYAFRGADEQSMDHLAVATGAPELPLSVSYRCPVSVVEEAQRYVPHMEYHEDAISGSVADTSLPFIIEAARRGDYTHNDLFLCRNNKPLIRLALAMMRSGNKFNMTTTFPGQLIGFIKKFEAESLHQLRVRLEVWYEEMQEKYQERPGRMASIVDRYESLVYLIEESSTIDQMLDALKEMLSSEEGPRLSTIHKAKGTEARHVFIIGPELMPSRFAKSDAAIKQEHNITYVAITRSLESLRYVFFDESRG